MLYVQSGKSTAPPVGWESLLILSLKQTGQDSGESSGTRAGVHGGHSPGGTGDLGRGRRARGGAPARALVRVRHQGEVRQPNSTPRNS